MEERMLKHSIRVAGLGLATAAAFTAGIAQAQDKGTVHLAYVEWSSEVASTNVLRAALEQAGFEVDMTSLSARSEEHTSELQSRGHLVCRLLLEKKKHPALGRL